MMEAPPPEAEVLGKLTAWAVAQPAIRAMILTSSRARPGGPVDLLSDYDIILAVTGAERFVREDTGLSEYGEPMVRWGDESARFGLPTYFRSVIYTDSVKLDYTFWPDALLERVAEQAALPDELDEGYRVLLDKEGRTANWKQPTHRAFIPARPTAAEYEAVVEEFWWTTTYVAKSLWRDELVFARWVLDEDIKNGELRRMLEWRLEIDHGWSVRPGVNGRGLKRLLPPDVWEELSSTYVGPEIEANWAALFRTTALFRRIAREVADALGFIYPQRMDDQVSAHLGAIRQL
jgi:aminoglycoside 6-adenylyltransferase